MKPRFPPRLALADELGVDLDRKKRVSLARCRVEFSRCVKPVNVGLNEAYARKPQVIHEAHALFPEIAVLSLFRQEGWDGVWVDAARRKYFDRMPNQSKGITLNSYVGKWLARIADNNRGSHAGCWDLILWHEKDLLFLLLKGLPTGERVPRSAFDWLDAALKSGLFPEQFMMVEWDYRRVIVRRKASSLPGAGAVP